MDIEDCIGPENLGPLDRLRSENKLLPRALRRKVPVSLNSNEDGSVSGPVADSFIPGTQSIYIKTWGCSHNNSDGEYMAGLLASNGYTITGKVVVPKLVQYTHLNFVLQIPPSVLISGSSTAARLRVPLRIVSTIPYAKAGSWGSP